MAEPHPPFKFGFFPSLDALPGDSASLWRHGLVDSFFLSRSWFESMLAAGINPKDSIAIAVLQSGGGDLLALLPARFRDHRSLLWRRRRLTSLTDMYTCLFQPVLAPDVDVLTTARALGRQLGNALVSSDVIELDALDGEWRGLPAFENGLREAGFRTVRYLHFGNWFEEMAERSFDEYVATRSGSLREILRRRQRALVKRAAHFIVISSADGLSRGISDYERVYSLSWKPAEPHPRFHDHLMRRAARDGVLRLGLCYIDDRPIAAQVWVVSQRRATVLKLAHDQEFDRYSPGSVLLAHMIRHVVEHDQATELDFGRGDDAYKREWATRRRQRIGLLAANPRSSIGLAVLARQAIGRCLAAIGRWTRPS